MTTEHHVKIAAIVRDLSTGAVRSGQMTANLAWSGDALCARIVESVCGHGATLRPEREDRQHTGVLTIPGEVARRVRVDFDIAR